MIDWEGLGRRHKKAALYVRGPGLMLRKAT